MKTRWRSLNISWGTSASYGRLKTTMNEMPLFWKLPKQDSSGKMKHGPFKINWKRTITNGGWCSKWCNSVTVSSSNVPAWRAKLKKRPWLSEKSLNYKNYKMITRMAVSIKKSKNNARLPKPISIWINASGIWITMMPNGCTTWNGKMMTRSSNNSWRSKTRKNKQEKINANMRRK